MDPVKYYIHISNALTKDRLILDDGLPDRTIIIKDRNSLGLSHLNTWVDTHLIEEIQKDSPGMEKAFYFSNFNKPPNGFHFYFMYKSAQQLKQCFPNTPQFTFEENEMGETTFSSVDTLYYPQCKMLDNIEATSLILNQWLNEHGLSLITEEYPHQIYLIFLMDRLMGRKRDGVNHFLFFQEQVYGASKSIHLPRYQKKILNNPNIQNLLSPLLQSDIITLGIDHLFEDIKKYKILQRVKEKINFNFNDEPWLIIQNGIRSASYYKSTLSNIEISL